MEPEAVTEAEAAVAPVVIAVAVSAAVVHVATFADAEFVGGDHLARLRVHEGVDVRAVVLHHADVQDGTVVAAVMAAAARMAAVVFLIFIVKTSSNSCSCRCAGERLACRGALFESD